VQQYEKFLDRVREANIDEYPDIKKILQRYEILKETQSKLREEQQREEAILRAKTADITAY